MGEAAAGVGEGGFGGVLEVFECLPGGQDGCLGRVDHGVRRSGEEVGEVLFGLGEAAAGVGECSLGGAPEVFQGLSGGEDGGLGGVDVALGCPGQKVVEILRRGLHSGSSRVDICPGCAGEEVGEVLFGLSEAAVGVSEGGVGGVQKILECLAGGEGGGFGGSDIGGAHWFEKVVTPVGGFCQRCSGRGDGGRGCSAQRIAQSFLGIE